MRLQLEQPAFADELVVFLARCDWLARRVAFDVFDVTLPAARRLEARRHFARTGLCMECGGEIANSLAELGSLLCHDCRDGDPRGSNGAQSHEYRVELEGYLKVWNALHPTALTTFVEEQHAKLA